MTQRTPSTVTTLLIVLLSLIVGGAVLATPAAAQTNTGYEVAPDGEVTITLTPEDTGNTLAIEGETDGWTINSTTPEGVAVNPVAGTVLGPDDSISTFQSYENGEFSVTLTPPDDASGGDTYQFDVQEVNDGTTVESSSFTISIETQNSESGDESDSESGDESDSESGDGIVGVEVPGFGIGSALVAIVSSGYAIMRGAKQ